MSSFEEELNLQLVREVEKHPLLYNFRLPEYTKRELIEAAWNAIAEKMNDDPTNCREKWRNLRTVFVRKLKPLPNGELKRKPYYLGDAMSFLTPFIKLQRTDDSTEGVASPGQSESENVTQSEEVENHEVEEGDANMQPDVPAVSNVFLNVPANYHQPLLRRPLLKRSLAPKDFTEYPEPKRSRYSEADESRKYFLLSLVPEVQRLTDVQMKFFRRKVLDAIDDAEAYPSENAQAMYFNEDIRSTQNGGVAADSFFQTFSPKKEC